MAKQRTPKQQFIQEFNQGKHRQYTDGNSAAYAWRIKSNMDKGVSRSQARGHARTKQGERRVSEIRGTYKRSQSTYKVMGTKHTRTSYDSLDAVERRLLRSKGQQIMVMVTANGQTYTTRAFRLYGGKEIDLLLKDIDQIVTKYGFGGRDNIALDIDGDDEAGTPGYEFSVVRITKA